MNQQRSRRFRAAKDSREQKQIIHDIKQKLIEKGVAKNKILFCLEIQ